MHDPLSYEIAVRGLPKEQADIIKRAMIEGRYDDNPYARVLKLWRKQEMSEYTRRKRKAWRFPRDGQKVPPYKLMWLKLGNEPFPAGFKRGVVLPDFSEEVAARFTHFYILSMTHPEEYVQKRLKVAMNVMVFEACVPEEWSPAADLKFSTIKLPEADWQGAFNDPSAEWNRAWYGVQSIPICNWLWWR